MHKLTESYKTELKSYDDFKIKIEVLVRELLVQNNINYHKIESRAKDPIKLDEKIVRKNDKYNCLEDITDLIGIRVITFFEDEVDRIAQIIESEFILDKTNSIDKRQTESDRFGYKSLHYVVSLTDQRKKLTEYKRFKNIKCEIQIRSILQHAWAEIEHDIGYKGEYSVPDALKRNFYRVAALLETADIEFVNIKEKLRQYEETVSEDIKKHPEDVELNSASLNSFINNNNILQKLDSEISAVTKMQIHDEVLSNVYLLDKLYFLNIKTIKELEISLLENGPMIVAFAKEWLKDSDAIKLTKAISIFYLCYLLVGKMNDLKLASDYYSKTILKGTADNEDQAKRILETFKIVNGD